MRKLVFLLLLVSAVLGWAECYMNGPYVANVPCSGESSCPGSYTESWGILTGLLSDQAPICWQGSMTCRYQGYCTNHCQADSIAGCPDGYVWNSDSCQCEKQCTDSLRTYQKCVETWNNGYLVDGSGELGGGGYWQINLFNCTYDPCDSTEICTEGSHFPAGSLTCDDWGGGDGCQGGDCGRCIAVIGSQCTIQCPNNVTINCGCDGSCNNAVRMSDCKCPEQSSSSGGSSSSGESSSSGDGSSSSMSSSSAQSSSSELPRSSSSPKDSSNGDWEYDYSQVLNEIEYNTRLTSNNTKQIASNTNEIATNTNIAAGYLSSIDKMVSTMNFNMQEESGQIIHAIESGATQVANASNAVADSVGRSNEILEQINSSVGVLGDSVEIPDISVWLDSANSSVESLKNPETTFVRVDSLQSDTSRFKSKYSSMFLTNVYTRNGCYEFKIAKPSQNSVFGRFFSTDIVVNFGNLANTFDLCAILRGICRIAGAILVLLISIKSYRSAFSSSDG